MLRKFLPHPLLTLTITAVWIMLVHKVTLGNLLLGAFLGIVLPVMTAPYWPDRPQKTRPLKLAAYVALVFWDVVVANIVVAGIILFKRNQDIKSAWINVPLDLTNAEAITLLAGTITMTPGTVSAMLAADGRSILVHCLHTDDPVAIRDEIKTRYEARLMEIFP